MIHYSRVTDKSKGIMKSNKKKEIENTTDRRLYNTAVDDRLDTTAIKPCTDQIPIFLIGNSLGGWVALRALQLGLHHTPPHPPPSSPLPFSVRGCVLLGPLTNLDATKNKLYWSYGGSHVTSTLSRLSPNLIVSKGSLPNTSYIYKNFFLASDPVFSGAGRGRLGGDSVGERGRRLGGYACREGASEDVSGVWGRWSGLWKNWGAPQQTDNMMDIGQGKDTVDNATHGDQTSTEGSTESVYSSTTSGGAVHTPAVAGEAVHTPTVAGEAVRTPVAAGGDREPALSFSMDAARASLSSFNLSSLASLHRPLTSQLSRIVTSLTSSAFLPSAPPPSRHLPPLPPLGVRACVAHAMLKDVDLVMEGAPTLTESICPSYLILHNRHDSMCSAIGSHRLYQSLHPIKDRKLVVINAASRPVQPLGEEGRWGASGWGMWGKERIDGTEGGDRQEGGGVSDQEEMCEEEWWMKYSEEDMEGIDVHHSIVSDPHGHVVLERVVQWIIERT
eukprot:GHVQ01029983.1.p1 GENE.GHVQ01029983.1~~GHVQ01029983.1.p1  ORF type:complete len:502 (-),score=104.03 GHVQ01029983.1:254-1759(-)